MGALTITNKLQNTKQQPRIGAVFFITTDKNRIQAYIDDGLLEKLKAYAASHRLSVSQAVERLLLESDSPTSNSPEKLIRERMRELIKNLPSDSPLTVEDSIEQLREFAYSNAFAISRSHRISNERIAQKMKAGGYPLPEGIKAWTPEVVSHIIQNKGRL
jgi:uncharacterized membrane-anchored protein YjiN (DUF445 family)